LASIDQKAQRLQPIPFSNAIRFSSNKKYLPLALIPLLFCLYFYVLGQNNILAEGLHRVVNYQEQFIPPAPFRFEVLNAHLQTQQHQDFTLRVRTVGKVIPANAVVFIGNENYYMEQEAPGVFSYTFTQPYQSISFHVEANAIDSPELALEVVEVPAITNLAMQLQYPFYLGKKSEQVLTMIGPPLILSRLQLNNAGLKIMLLGLPTVSWFAIPMHLQQLSGTGVI
jgi:hypothetical protein